MAKKQQTSEYTVVIGCNVECTEQYPAGTRYEAGDTLGDVSAKTLAALLEMEAVELAEPVEEESDVDSED